MTARAPAQLLTAPVSHAAAPGWDRPLAWLATALIILGVGYGLVMLALARREPRGGAAGTAAPPADPFFVFLMPCLNEEKVIGGSLRRLLSMSGGNFAVMVVDDGSDDHTAAMVTAAADPRVWLLRRTAPNARRGKGEALNAAIAHLTGSGRLANRDPGDVIIAVVDADGRLDPHAMAAVAPHFRDPSVGAVQIGVRISNRDHSMLARMQDMEFVIYTEVFQRGRRHLGSVGLGGNGQFVRLAALRSLGPAPWSRSLTEDLDLGVRLAAEGWRNEYCPGAAVHQQGVVSLRRLLRQRSRWFQGHLQSWKLIGTVLRRLPGRARADMLYHLTSPAILLIASLLSVSFLLSLVDSIIDAAAGKNPAGWWIAISYALVLGPALAYGHVYWRRERRGGLRLPGAVWLAHLYAAYSLLWFASGWWAAGRTLRGRTGWAKTEREAEAPAAPPQTAGVGAPAPTAVAPGGRPARRKRHPVAVSVLVTVLAAVAASTAAGVLHAPPQPRHWLTVFDGNGMVSVTGPGAGQVITLRPGRARTRAATHAGLVVSAARYRDFTAAVTVRTVRQLRAGAAGAPHAWEVGWVLWHYTSSRRFYALTLERGGWVLSKQSPGYPGGERFLASGTTPRFAVGVPHLVKITQAGSHITVTADGHLLTRFTDTQRPYPGGALGLYTEDAQARFSDIHITSLPARGQRG